MVFLVGTIHLAQSSADAVKRVIECIKPDNVVVELCRTRVGAMYGEDTSFTTRQPGSESTQIRAASMRKAVQDALKGSSSLPALTLRLMADSVSSRIQDQVLLWLINMNEKLVCPSSPEKAF